MVIQDASTQGEKFFILSFLFFNCFSFLLGRFVLIFVAGLITSCSNLLSQQLFSPQPLCRRADDATISLAGETYCESRFHFGKA